MLKTGYDHGTMYSLYIGSDGQYEWQKSAPHLVTGTIPSEQHGVSSSVRAWGILSSRYHPPSGRAGTALVH